jgi:hypothetical protein
MALNIWGAASAWTLTALPLFVWMGEILFRTKLSENLFRGLTPWLHNLPGGLLHVNITGSAIFAAICGSSAATVLTVGKMAVPELKRRKYPEKDDHRHAGRCRHAGPAHSAVDHPHHLWRHGERKHRETVHRRHSARHPAGAAVHGIRRRLGLLGGNKERADKETYTASQRIRALGSWSRSSR